MVLLSHATSPNHSHESCPFRHAVSPRRCLAPKHSSSGPTRPHPRCKPVRPLTHSRADAASTQATSWRGRWNNVEPRNGMLEPKELQTASPERLLQCVRQRPARPSHALHAVRAAEAVRAVRPKSWRFQKLHEVVELDLS